MKDTIKECRCINVKLAKLIAISLQCIINLGIICENLLFSQAIWAETP